MSEGNQTALLLLVEALLSTRDRKNVLFEDAVQALLSMITRKKVLPSAELEAQLSTMIRQKILAKDEIIEAIDDAAQRLLADRPAEAEFLQALKRKILDLTCPG
jgi:hypothetical protein